MDETLGPLKPMTELLTLMGQESSFDGMLVILWMTYKHFKFLASSWNLNLVYFICAIHKGKQFVYF